MLPKLRYSAFTCFVRPLLCRYINVCPWLLVIKRNYFHSCTKRCLWAFCNTLWVWVTFMAEIDRIKRKYKKKCIGCTTSKKYVLFCVGVFRINQRFHKSSISVQSTELSLLFELATSQTQNGICCEEVSIFEKRLAEATSGRWGEEWHSSIWNVQKRRCFEIIVE